MNKYETVIIMSNEVSDEKRKEVLNKVKDQIIKNGKIDSVEELGERVLAYEIKKHKKAYYYVINFELQAEEIAELERLYRITDEILKFIVVRKEK